LREFDCQLIELYGLTEGLITILEPEDFERKLQSVGKPVLGADIRILGETTARLRRARPGRSSAAGGW
jgi:long-subunit acyl-CoA synthetase (AMP-forming)